MYPPSIASGPGKKTRETDMTHLTSQTFSSRLSPRGRLPEWIAEAKALLWLSGPLIITQLAQMAILATDVVLLGRLSSHALAAAAIGNAVYYFCWLMGGGPTAAVAPIIAQMLGRKPDDLKYMLANMKDLVVKEVHGAGGYGMLVGPAATKAEVEEFRKVLLANPSNYIAQPTLSLSTCPTYVESGIAPRHIDLRPFVLSGKEVQMVPGGLTRVALKEGSLVVNSSQGGGSKDTWIINDEV